MPSKHGDRPKSTTSLYLDEYSISELNWAFRLAGGPDASWGGFVRFLESTLAHGHRAASAGAQPVARSGDEGFERAFEYWLTGPVARLVEPLDAYVTAFETIEHAVRWRRGFPAFSHVFALAWLGGSPTAWLHRNPGDTEWIAPVAMLEDAVTILDRIIRDMDRWRDWPTPPTPLRWIWRRGRLDAAFEPTPGPASLTVVSSDHRHAKRLAAADVLPRAIETAAACLRDPHYWVDLLPAVRLLNQEDLADTDLRPKARLLIEDFRWWAEGTTRSTPEHVLSGVRRAQAAGPSPLHHALEFHRRYSWGAPLVDFDPPGVSDGEIELLTLALTLELHERTDEALTERTIASALQDTVQWSGFPTMEAVDRLARLLCKTHHRLPYYSAAEYHVTVLVDHYLRITNGDAHLQGSPSRTPYLWASRAWAYAWAPVAPIWRWIDPNAELQADGRVDLKIGGRHNALEAEEAAWLADLLESIVPLDQRHGEQVTSYPRGALAWALLGDAKGRRPILTRPHRASVRLDQDLGTFLVRLARNRPGDAQDRAIDELLGRVTT